MKQKTRFLAAFMSLVMLVSSLPLTAFATSMSEGTNTETQEAVLEGLEELDLSAVNIVSEDVLKRTEYEKHFNLDNGTVLAVQYSRPVHRLDAEGNWRDIAPTDSNMSEGYRRECDTLISEVTDDGTINLESVKGHDMLSLEPMMNEEKAAGDENIAEQDPRPNETEESIYQRNIRLIENAIHTSTLQFQNVFSNADMECSPTEDGFRENILVKEKAEKYEFTYQLHTGGLKASLTEEGYICIADEGGTVTYEVETPYMSDCAEKYSDSVSYELTEEEDGKYFLTVAADPAWINDEEQKLPVSISLGIYQSGDGTGNNGDTYISSANPDNNYSYSYQLKTGQDQEDGATRAFLSLEEMPKLESTDTLLEARLFVYGENKEQSKTTNVEAHRIMETWSADQVTWENQPEYTSDTLEKVDNAENVDGNVQWDVTSIAADWYAEKEVHGIALVATDEATGTASAYYSREAGQMAPYVLVNYVSADQKTEEGNVSEAPDSESKTEEAEQEWENVGTVVVGDENNTEESSESDTRICDFERASGITYEYSVYNSSKWNKFHGRTVDAQLDGLRFQTGDKPYYFKYRVRNGNKGWLEFVSSKNSGEYDFAGLHDQIMDGLEVQVYLQDGTRIYDNCVVMYRVKVADNWLKWVSNGSLDIMDSIKRRFLLTGELDPDATFAGDARKGRIQAVEFRVYERIGWTPEPGGSDGNFEEINGGLQEYLQNGTWSLLYPQLPVGELDGVRLLTKSKDFYLRYRSRNEGKGWLDFVRSTDAGANDFAGWSGYPMTNLAIEVYDSNNNRIYDNYVVMYRAQVAGKWLDWVSNGRPDVMQSIQKQFGLSGNLDTSSTDAGWASLGNIQALEIRFYQRMGSGGSGGTVGTGEFEPASGIGMEYYKNRQFIQFDSTVSVGEIDGVRLQTPGKPYYFSYRTRDSAHGWLDFVSSANSGSNDYAGWPGHAMTNLEIRVYQQDGTRIYDNYVVMYRAKVAGEWLEWVSNGNPSAMQEIQNQYGLPGALDTKATNAGWSSRGNIEGLEIRVYERGGMIARPSENAVILDVPYINQKKIGMPNGCESVSTVMALQYFGVDITPDVFVSKYLDMGPTVMGSFGSDPSLVFVGDPRRADGWGCYAPVILKALNKFIGNCGLGARKFNNQSLSSLCSQYIDKGIPVIMWATVGMVPNERCSYWFTPTQKRIAYNNKLHCVLLVGYDENYYYFNDPLADMGSQKYVGYPRASVERAYELLGKQAVVISKEWATEPGDPESPVIKPDDPWIIDGSTQIDSRPSAPDSIVSDPIDLSRGAHVIDSTLMTIQGAKMLSLDVKYSSDVQTKGMFGTGWSHNYEKKLLENGTKIRVFDSPTYYAEYEKTSDNVYKSDTITKEGYVVTKTSNGYEVNCNYKSTEYYDKSGKLYKIVSKDGFATLIQYPSSHTIKITEAVSGKYMTLELDSSGKVVKVSDNAGRTCLLGYTGDFLTSITDENGSKTIYEYTDKGQIKRGMDGRGIVYFYDTYDSAGRIISQQDAISSHPTTMISYDTTTVKDHTVVRVSDRLGNVSTYKYNSSRQLVSKTDANGVTTTYGYDAAGYMTKKTDGLGHSATNVYDTKGNLTSSTDRNGNKTEFTYDGRNNLTKIKYPDGGTVSYTYDSNNRLISDTDLRGVTSTYEYDANGLVTKKTYAGKTTTYTYQSGLVASTTDPLGRKTVNEYSAAGMLVSSTDANGNKTRYTYDKKGTMLTVTDAKGNTTEKQYDARGNLIKSIDAAGHATSYTYDGNLNMTSMTLPNGATIRYAYDNEDRLVKTSFPDGTTSTTKYDAGGRSIQSTDREGNATSYAYDAAGNVTRVTNALGGETKKVYDAEGNVTKSTEVVVSKAGGQTEERSTSYVYDAAGRLTKSTNAAGGTTVYTYNHAGDLLSTTDALGNKTVNTYDNRGNLTKVTDPRGNSTTYTYDAIENLLKTTNALGQSTTNQYDNLNRLISTKDPGGHTTSYTYDELGRQISCTDARGNTTRQYYDALGHVIKMTDQSDHIDFQAVYDASGYAVQTTDAAGSVTKNEYDWEGNKTKQTDAMGGTVTYTYNGTRQMVQSVDQAGSVSYATYDGMGNLTSTTGPEENVKRYTYNSLGQMETESTRGDNQNVYTYNALGLKASVENARGEVSEYTYDKAGRMVAYQDSDGRAEYTYDANGNVLTAKDAEGTVTREYDALNRVTKYTDVHGNTVLYEYDACGNLAKMTYPTGDIATYTYDGNHNMTKSAMSDGFASTFEYNPQNQITKITNPDGGTVTKTYDGAGRLQTLNDRDKNGKLLAAYVYTYDALSRITSELDPVHAVEYRMTYDDLGRLTKRTEYDTKDQSVLNEETFTYDTAGNITSDSTTGEAGNSYEYGANNSITSVNGVQLETDECGNTLHYIQDGKKLDVVYDAKNRIQQIGGDENQYHYDVENNRVSMSSQGISMTYTYDTSGGRNRLVWMEDQDNQGTVFVYGADGLMWSKSDGEYKIYHYDYRGSVVAVTDENGNLTDEIRYNAYGSVVGRTGTDLLIIGYNGRDGVLTEPNGLLFMRARYYSPALKRFMNADIILGSIADPSTLNLYAYVNGNPISYVDPFGLSKEESSNGGGYGEIISNLPNLVDWGASIREIAVRYQNYSRYGFNVKLVGEYARIKGARTPAAIGQGIKGTRYALKNAAEYPEVFVYVNPATAIKEALKSKLNIVLTVTSVGIGVFENIQEGTSPQRTTSDALVDTVLAVGSTMLSAAASAKTGAILGGAAGSVVPIGGNIAGGVVGGVVGLVVGVGIYIGTDVLKFNGQSISEMAKDRVGMIADGVADFFGSLF